MTGREEPGSITSAAGVSMPGILYGTAWKKARTAGLVEQALALGFRGIDTACQPKHYHEAGVGEGLAASLRRGLARSRIYLQSKFTPVDGHDPARIPYDPAAPLADQVIQSCAVSLENLRTDYLDGLILHSPCATPEATREAWRAMESLVELGRVRQLGISNCYDPGMLRDLHDAAAIKPAILQNRFHAATGHDRVIRELCRERGIVYQSFWTLTANADLLAHPSVAQMASTHGRTPAQILFRFLTQIGVVPLTGTTSAEHMRDDLAIFEFQLSTAECAALGGLL